MTEILKMLAVFVLGILAVYALIAVGYVFGMLLAITPFINGWLTGALPITTEQLPAILAWVVLIGLFLRGNAGEKSGE